MSPVQRAMLQVVCATTLLGVGVALLLAPRLPEPDAIGWRIVEFGAAFVVVCVGVAAYLAADSGAGPMEAAALAFDPPIPFRWSYSAVQIGSALVGWWCGADLGVGTVAVVVLIGPCVARLVPLFRPRPQPVEALAACC